MAKVNQECKHWWNFKGRGKFGVKSDQLGYWSSSVKEIMRAYYIGNRNGMEVLKMRDAKEILSIAHMHVQSLSRVWLFGTLWTVGCQAPVSMGFPRQEYWSGCHFLLQGIFLTQGLNLWLLPHLLHCRLILDCWATQEARIIYWAGQNVNLGFSVWCYGKTEGNFLANPVHDWLG